MILEQHYLGCLSQASYLIADEASGVAAVVDPRRDVEVYLDEARRRGLAIRHVVLTHFHADFVSGHLELRARTGATIHLGAGAETEFESEPLEDGQALDLGPTVRLRALATPGHTPESICVLVYDLERDADRPHAVLTGDTLFVGDVGRPDLMASSGSTAEELAGELYTSVHEKLLALPDETLVYPGHGAGSMCGKNLSSETVSTIGDQRRTNVALQPMSREEFVGLVTAGQPAAPRYFAHDAALNRRRRPTLDEALAGLRALPVDEVRRAVERDGAVVLDVRSPDAFAAGHLPGSVFVGLDGRFASWVGTLLDPATPLVLVAPRGREREAAMRLGRVGFDRVVGHLEYGGDDLEGLGVPLATTRRWDAAELAAALGGDGAPYVLDVRQPGEREAAAIEGSGFVPLAEVEDRAAEVPAVEPVVLHCAGGYRSMIAASLLERAGRTNVADLRGGMAAWKEGRHPVVAAAPA